MKVVQINAVCGKGSTGKICVDISKLLTEKGIENYILYSLGKSEYPLGIKFTNDKYLKIQALKSKLLGSFGFNSQAATKRLIKELEKINPNIVHLHNIHSNDINLEILFNYFRSKPQIKLYWTFHDCWAFTGYCTYFDISGCNKWKLNCYDCPQRKSFSFAFDKSAKLFEKKKKLFSGLNLTIVTPSKWLADLTKQSFLKDCDVKVINNGINLDIFKPTESNFREKYNLQDKKMILGVAFDWGMRKGLDVFIELSKRLTDSYQIVLVGTNSKIDEQLPKNIISIHKTANQSQLAEIYTAADVFANPTREENYPTVNMEALACGTPIVTFKTGGSPEIIDEKTGVVVNVNNIEEFEKSIIDSCESGKYTMEACINRAKSFNCKDRFLEYVDLYK